MPSGERPASTRSAIELMTAWLDSPAGPPDLLIDCLISHLDGPSSKANLSRAVELIMGFTYLSGSFLVMLEDETGVPAQELVRNLALQYAQDSVN
jgi:hypothetical protein